MAPRKTALCLLLVASAMLVCQLAGAQFFTKSSKSIPRMGRRSVAGSSATMGAGGQSYKRALIDALVDQYGPDLVEVLQAQVKASEQVKRASQGEVALRNDQPLDLVQSQAEFGDSPIEIFSLDRLAGPTLARDERSPHSALLALAGGRATTALGPQMLRGANQQQASGGDQPSLALRAFETNRLLKQLGSGQPLRGSYDTLVYGSRPDRQLSKPTQRQNRRASEQYFSYEDK